MGGSLIWALGDLDTARLPPAAGLYLRLDDHYRSAELRSRGPRLLRGGGDHAA